MAEPYPPWSSSSNVALRPHGPYTQDGHLDCHTAPVQCCFTVTQTVHAGRPPRLSHSSCTMLLYGHTDRTRRTATSTVTQLLYNVALRSHRPYTQDGHLDCHTAPVQCCFTVTQTVHAGRPPRLSHSSCTMLLYGHTDRTRRTATSTVTQTVRTIWDGEPRTATSTVTQLLYNVTLRSHRPYRLLGTWSPGRPSRLSHSSCTMLLYGHTDRQTIRDLEPRTATSDRLTSRFFLLVLMLLYVHRDHKDC